MPFGAYGRLPYFHYFQKPEKVIFSILLARMEDCHLISIISTKNQKRSISLFYKFFFSFWDLFPPEIEVQMNMSDPPNVKWTYTINGIRREWRIATLFPP